MIYKAKSLAACILKAENIAPGHKISNERYWYTREACGVIAKKERCIGQMIKLMHDARFQLSENLDTMAEPFWAQVAHPDILIMEVHEA